MTKHSIFGNLFSRRAQRPPSKLMQRVDDIDLKLELLIQMQQDARQQAPTQAQPSQATSDVGFEPCTAFSTNEEYEAMS